MGWVLKFEQNNAGLFFQIIFYTEIKLMWLIFVWFGYHHHYNFLWGTWKIGSYIIICGINTSLLHQAYRLKFYCTSSLHFQSDVHSRGISCDLVEVKLRCKLFSALQNNILFVVVVIFDW
eukprot:TRINITY_DN16003_c0_g1_i2.p2 TRINITY_DN16003_c0_g1~~TRINITY_DN16003_c0_g1_i2.p2  ORF type:complete len:120 (+),score=1.56 TRINITY_DN16003_c0_g1_i2:246-605(+)